MAYKRLLRNSVRAQYQEMDKLWRIWQRLTLPVEEERGELARSPRQVGPEEGNSDLPRHTDNNREGQRGSPGAGGGFGAPDRKPSE